jgi:molybdopterin converting factor subunit 1
MWYLVRAVRVNVRFFAAHREATGQKAFDADVPQGARAAEVLTLLTARFPQLAQSVHATAFAINRHQVPGETVLQEGDELALLPPMAGG